MPALRGDVESDNIAHPRDSLFIFIIQAADNAQGIRGQFIMMAEVR